MEFRKNGFNDEDAAQLGLVATMYQNVADEAISAGDAASFIISQMVAFDIPAENAQHIIDAVNEVSNAFSVSSADIAGSLGNMSAVMSQTGATFEQALGMLTAITEVTRNASKASRGLVSIGSRLNQVVDEGSTIGKQLIAIYEGLGIELFDSNGQLRSSYDIFTDLAAIWPTLDKNTQNYIASVQAGTNQFQNFAALMQNFGHATEATEVAMNSAGSAARENARYMESLQAKVAAVQASFQQLANTVIDSELVKAILDIVNALLQLGNTDIGKLVVQFGLLTGLLWGGSSLMSAMNILPAALGQFSTAIGLMTGKVTMAQVAMLAFKGTALEAAAASGTLSAAVTALGTTMSIALPLAAAIAAVVVAVIALKKAYDAATPSVEEINTKIDEQNKKIEENEARLKEINKIPYNARTSEIIAEKEALEAENEMLRQNIEYWERRRNNRLYRDLQTDKKYRIEKDSKFYAYSDINTLVAAADSEEELLEMIKKVNPGLYEQAETLEDTGLIIQEVGGGYESAADSADKMLIRYNYLAEKAKTVEGLTADEAAEFIELHDILGELTDGYQEVADGGKVLEDWQYKLIDSGREADRVYKEIAPTLYDVNDVLVMAAQGASLNSAQYDILKNKAAELGISESELATYIEESNGQFVLQVDALNNAALAGNEYAQAMVESMITALRAVMEASIAMNNQLTASRALMKAGSQEWIEAGNKIRDYNKTILSSAEAINKLESGKKLWGTSTGTGKTGVNLYPGSGSGSSGSSSSTDPIEKQNELFEEQNALMEHNIFLREKQGASEEELIELNKKYQNQLHEQAEWFRAHGYGDDSEYVRKLQEQWWGLQDNINDLEEQITERQREAFDERLEISENYIEERNKLSNWGADNEIEAWKRVLKWMQQWYDQGLVDYEYYLEKRQYAYEKYADAYKEHLESEKDLYETLFSVVADKAQEEIDALQEQRQEIEDRYQTQIDALQKVNDELDSQIEKEEALDALARARQTNVLVYKDGRFQYIQDVDEMSEAQANLEKIEREETLRKEVEALEELRDRELASIDQQIEYWQKYKEEWASVVSDYEKQQDLLLIEQEFGIKLEGENWEKRLGNLQDYVDEYLAILRQLEEGAKSIEESLADALAGVSGSIAGLMSGIGGLGGGGSSSGGGGGSVSLGGNYNATATVPGSGKVPVTIVGGKTQQTGLPVGTIVHTNGGDYKITGEKPGGGYTSVKVNKHATGTLSARGGFSLLGENGPELGVLQPGDGVIPADVTKNLWSWGMTTPSSLLATIMGVGKFGQTVSIAIDTFAPELPNVTDGDSFANYMKNNFWRQVVQTQRT